MTDTELQQLVVWVGTTEKIEQARAQGLITENDFAITTDAPDFQTKLTSANAGTGISITEVGGVVKISNTQTSAEWGNILGNLPDQADLWGYLSDILSDISDIKSLIPAQASSSNQLADKAFVNSTVQTATANFRGNWEDWADVPVNAEDYPLDFAQSRTPTVNDYLVVRDASDYALETLEGTWRFKYSGEWSINGKNGWHPEYQVNETPLTAAQLAALNSGATEAKINQITTNQNAIGTLANLTTTEKNNLVGAVNELDSTKQDNITDLQQIRDGAAAGATALQDVQVNGTSVVSGTTANIPKASNSTLGVVQTNGSYGIEISANGYIATIPAAEATLAAKLNGRNVVVANNLDIAVREGLGNNSLTWSDAYKVSACKTIGTISGVQINSTDLTPDATTNKVNIPTAGDSSYGVVKTNSTTYGIGANADGILFLRAATTAQIDAKTTSFFPLMPSTLDYAVKVGITTNTNTLTTAEKTAARSWIGAEAKSVIETIDATDSITLADNTIYNGGEQTALTIALPATVDVSFLCEVCFSSGSTATTLTYPQSGINWVGDDVSSNVFTPVASKRYTIICSYDGSNYLFVVKGV